MHTHTHTHSLTVSHASSSTGATQPQLLPLTPQTPHFHAPAFTNLDKQIALYTCGNLQPLDHHKT